MTTPRQATASWYRASSAATTGSSIAPGTRTTSGSGIPHAAAAAVARATSESVISACQRVAAIARLSPDASTAAGSGRPSPLMGCLLLARSCGLCLTGRQGRAATQRDRSQGDRGWYHGPFCFIEILNLVAELVALCDQIAEVVRGDGGGQRDTGGDVDTAIGQPAHLGRVVGQQAYRAHAQVGQHLGAGRVLARIDGQAEFGVGVHRVGTRVLQFVGLQLAEQADPATLVTA